MEDNRRVFLIEKKYREGLNEAEIAELAALQEQMGRHLDEVTPLPVGLLEWLETTVERIERSTGKEPERGTSKEDGVCL